MIKIGFKSIIVGFILTTCINLIYGIDNVQANVIINIILIALSFGLLMLEDKNKSKIKQEIEKEQEKKENAFKESILINLSDRNELNKIIELLEVVISSNSEFAINSNKLNIENKEILLSMEDIQKEVKNSILEILKSNNSNNNIIADSLLNINNKLDNNIKVLDEKLNILQGILDNTENTNKMINISNRSIDDIGILITKMNAELNENRHLITITKAINRIDKSTSNIEDELEDLSSDLENNINILNGVIAEHKKKNDRNINDVAELIESLTEILKSQQGDYEEINHSVLDKMKTMTEVSSRNVKLLKDSYNTLDKIVNNIV